MRLEESHRKAQSVTFSHSTEVGIAERIEAREVGSCGQHDCPLAFSCNYTHNPLVDSSLRKAQSGSFDRGRICTQDRATYH